VRVVPALQLLLMALTGWLARREREVVVYLIDEITKDWTIG
jgi:hypothetical protein